MESNDRPADSIGRFDVSGGGFKRPSMKVKLSFAEVFGFAFRGFVANLGVFILGAALVIALQLAGSWILQAFTALPRVSFDTVANFGLLNFESLGGLISSVYSCAISTLIAVVFAHLVLKVSRGQKLAVADLFVLNGLPHAFLLVLGTLILKTATHWIFLSEWIIDGFLWFAIFFVVAQKANVVSAALESIKLVWNELATCFVFSVLCMLANFLGALTFGIGLLVTIPITHLVTVYLFQKLRGGNVWEQRL